MALSGVRLADVKAQSTDKLQCCEGYVWHEDNRIGKGTFGEVFLGWKSVSCSTYMYYMYVRM